MKKLLSLILALSMLLCLAACGPASEPENPTGDETQTTVRLAGMKGPTTMGLVKLLSDSEAGRTQNKYEYGLYGKADEFTPALLRGDLDMAALPANVAATLYGKTNGALTVLAVNTLGVVYIVEKGDTVHSVADLAGKKIYAVGRSTTPEYALSYILSENGMSMDDLTVEWKSEATEILPLLKTEENAIAMIPQPFVSAASAKVEGLRVALSLNDEWEALDNGSQFVTGVMVARRDFVEENPEAVAKFLEEYQDSIAYAAEDLDGAAALVVQYGVMDDVNLAKAALPHCSLHFLSGEEMKGALSGYLTTLHAQDPQAVGGTLPDGNFYYVEKDR